MTLNGRPNTSRWVRRCNAILLVVLALTVWLVDDSQSTATEVVLVDGPITAEATPDSPSVPIEDTIPAPSVPRQEVVLLGDSIAAETSPYLRLLLGETNLIEQTFGGTAPCDWFDDDLQLTPSRIVVVSFTGNSLTPCMVGDAGGFLQGHDVVDKYRIDLTDLVNGIRFTGASVLLVGQPQRGPAADNGGDGSIVVAGINTIYAELAAMDGVSLVDAGAALETEDGDFAQALPCLAGEAECEPTGVNSVRTDDGLHLCPVALAPCPVYSSGAFRFANTIANAIPAQAAGI